MSALRGRPEGVQQATLDIAGADSPDTLPALGSAVQGCTRCPLYLNATQGVPGEGPQPARLMIVGEQPGDQEDLAGRPFVGPAGKVFDAAMERVGLDRATAYVTNAVKHFKFEQRGKRRIHAKPSTGEINACNLWFVHERRLVRPELIVAMGATALRAVLGKAVSVSSLRGAVQALPNGTRLIATVHPSYLLRIEDEQQKRIEWRGYLADLETVRALLDQTAPA